MTHTKGPWKHKDGIISDDFLIAAVGLRSDDEHLANASLIAAAPELLGALMVAVQYLEHPDVQAIPFALPASGVAKRARDAIAKAESRPTVERE